MFATVGKPEVEAQWINLFFPRLCRRLIFRILTYVETERELVNLVACNARCRCAIDLCSTYAYKYRIAESTLSLHIDTSTSCYCCIPVNSEPVNSEPVNHHTYARDLWHSNETSRISQNSRITYVQRADTNHSMGVCAPCGFFLFFIPGRQHILKRTRTNMFNCLTNCWVLSTYCGFM